MEIKYKQMKNKNVLVVSDVNGVNLKSLDSPQSTYILLLRRHTGLKCQPETQAQVTSQGSFTQLFCVNSDELCVCLHEHVGERKQHSEALNPTTVPLTFIINVIHYLCKNPF